MTEPTRCAVCVNFTLKGQTRSHLGLYTCKLKRSFEYVSPFRLRDCAAFQLVKTDQLPSRLKWEATAS